MNTNQKIIIAASGMAVSYGVKALLKKGWEGMTGSKPPENPAQPKVQWQEAVVWTVAVSAVGGLAKMVFNKKMIEKLN